MKSLPESMNALLLRTDFSDSDKWEAICAAIRSPDEPFQANVDFVSDPEYEALTTKQLLALIPEESNRSFVFLADQTAITHHDHPILVIDLLVERGRSFRVTPSALAIVENNLSIANMDFEEFAECAGPDGIFRGIPES